jgi:Asp-tRNA(Asn)/Glu-tRNA(Gln) amidotransferase B subunit
MHSHPKQNNDTQSPIEVSHSNTPLTPEAERHHKQIEAGLAEVDASRVVSQKEIMHFAALLKASK